MIALLLQAAATITAPWTPVERATPGGGHSVAASAFSADGTARLVVRCDRVAAPVVSIQFIPREQGRRFGVQPVSLQFDGGTPLVDNWEVMGIGLIERDDGAMTTLANGIAHAKAIRLHSVAGDETVVDHVFPGPGGDAPIRRVLAACGFTLGQLPQRTPVATATPAPKPSDTDTP